MGLNASVVTDEGKGILEIKNIATAPEYQGKGYGKALIDFVAAKYKREVFDTKSWIRIACILSFLKKSGFVRSHSIKNFLLITMTTLFLKVGFN